MSRLSRLRKSQSPDARWAAEEIVRLRKELDSTKNLILLRSIELKEVPVKIYTEFKHDHGLPEYAKMFDSGMDIRANAKVVIEPKETVLIPTGLYLGIPPGWEVQVRPRSGMSLKTKLRVSNAPGTVDSGYFGEVCIIADNTHGSVEMTIGLGERIAQIVLAEVPRIQWVPVASKDLLGESDRGEGGFGSTGA